MLNFSLNLNECVITIVTFEFFISFNKGYHSCASHYYYEKSHVLAQKHYENIKEQEQIHGEQHNE